MGGRRGNIQNCSQEVSAAVMLQALMRGFLMRVRKRGGFDGGDRAAAQGNGEGDGLQRPAGLAMGSADPHMLRLDDDRVVRWRMEEGRWWILERWQGRCWWRWQRRWGR